MQMLFEVCRQRIHGVPIPKAERHRIVPAHGDLRMEELPAEAMGRRLCRVASLHTLDHAINDRLLPPLYDACLLWVAPLGMVLGGVELDGDRAYYQTWFITHWERSAVYAGWPCDLISRDNVGRDRIELLSASAKLWPVPYGSAEESPASRV